MKRGGCIVLFIYLLCILKTTGQAESEMEKLDVPPKNYEGASVHILDPNKPDVLLNSDPEWVCKIWYVFKGTRSEGMHVQIIHEKKLLLGGRKKKKVVTPYGEFEWKGEWSARTNLFDLSGWVPVKLESLFPSKNRNIVK